MPTSLGTSVIDRAALRQLRVRMRGESGFSLMELIVAMGIFTIFIAIFLGAVVSLARGTSQARITAESTSGVLTVFQNLDRQIRYSDAINYPGVGPSGYRYIEFRTPASSTVENVTKCTQWRFMPDKGRIESRSWPDGLATTATPWATKLTNVITVAGVNYPFGLTPATDVRKQTFLLTINAGTAGTAGGTDIATKFIARNSSLSSPSNADANGDGVSDTPVCPRSTAVRP